MHTCEGRRSSWASTRIEVSGLGYAVGGVEILKCVDAGMPGGEITAVVGPSGAGKSTLLRAINRLIEPSSGEVYLDGVPTSGLDPLQVRRRVGMVFQIPVLFGGSVEEAVLYGARLSGKDADPGRLLEMVGLDVSLAGRDPQALSVGQQQRVTMARALALEPEALLLDEPTSALDQAARRRIEELVRDLNTRLGLTMVFVSHDLAQVERAADRVVAYWRRKGAWGRGIGTISSPVRESGRGDSSRGGSSMEGLQTVGSALLTLGLVTVAVALSFYERLGLEKDIGVAVVRSFVQLAAIGYVIDFIFGLDSLEVVVLLLAGMVLFAAWTSARRARDVPRAFLVAAVAVGVAAVATLGLLLTLRIVPATARYLIPLGGMVIGNSMNAASLTMTRIRDDVAEQRPKVEAALALGATSRQAVAPILRTALQSAPIPLIDATKTTGIIFLPGAMVGMIIAGADPLEAVRLQIIVLYMLLGSVSIAAILVGTLSYRSFFTPRNQLQTSPPEH